MNSISFGNVSVVPSNLSVKRKQVRIEELMFFLQKRKTIHVPKLVAGGLQMRNTAFLQMSFYRAWFKSSF